MSAAVSIIYNKDDDRLHLLLTTQDQQQYEGVITRRLFKILLKSLPNWLAQHSGPVQSEAGLARPVTEQSANRQHAVNQFNFSSAQDITEKKHAIKIREKSDGFLVVQIAFSMKEDAQAGKQLQLVLAAKDKQQNITLSLTTDQLYKVIGVMLEKASDWDLVNPWKNTHFIETNDRSIQLH